MQLNGIHHVAIICSDYQRSKQFYCDILGFAVVAETYRAERQSYKLDLALSDGTQIELFSFPNPPPRTNNPESRGLRHLAFKVSDVAATTDELKMKGVPVEPIRIDSLTGKHFTFFADPDGLPLELYQS